MTAKESADTVPSPSAGAAHLGAPAVTAVLPLFNKRHYVERCLASVAEAARSHGSVEVIVVDHGSTDGSYEAAARWRDSLRLCREPVGTIAHVRNTGAKLASARILAFVDSDCVVPPNYFATLEAIIRDRRVAATGFEVGVPDAGTWVERVWQRLHDRGDAGPRHYVNAASFSVTREAFEAVGGFNERLITGEDTDICLRLRSAGFEIWAAPALRVIHLDNPRTLAAFFRKELWRGLGGFGATLLRRRMRSSAMVIAFGIMVAAALFVTFSPLPSPTRVVASAMLVLAVPLCTVAFRFWQSRRVYAPIRSVILYFAFYLARLSALCVLLGRGLWTDRSAAGSRTASGSS